MIALAIEASGASASVQIQWRAYSAETDGVLSAERTLSGRSLAETLIPALEELFIEANCSAADISRLLISTGPGSFTGIRTALSFALGFSSGSSLSSRIELHAMSVFVAGCARLESAHVAEPRRIFAWIPASPTDAYYTVFLLSGQTLREEIAPAVVGLEQIECQAKTRNAEAVKIENVTAQDVLTAFDLFQFETPSDQLRPFSWSSPIEPLYIKGVQAKTLSERAASPPS